MVCEEEGSSSHIESHESLGCRCTYGAAANTLMNGLESPDSSDSRHVTPADAPREPRSSAMAGSLVRDCAVDGFSALEPQGRWSWHTARRSPGPGGGSRQEDTD